jgi:hypothetical protein
VCVWGGGGGSPNSMPFLLRLHATPHTRPGAPHLNRVLIRVLTN